MLTSPASPPTTATATSKGGAEGRGFSEGCHPRRGAQRGTGPHRARAAAAPVRRARARLCVTHCDLSDALPSARVDGWTVGLLDRCPGGGGGGTSANICHPKLHARVLCVSRSSHKFALTVSHTCYLGYCSRYFGYLCSCISVHATISTNLVDQNPY